jgi:hypothetical protein
MKAERDCLKVFSRSMINTRMTGFDRARHVPKEDSMDGRVHFILDYLLISMDYFLKGAYFFVGGMMKKVFEFI